jgi:hydroxymethylpyrimidine pyrophosphatase-like HAD family hydrolase
MIDYGSVGVTRESGLREVARILGAELGEVACIGGVLNDASVLQTAGETYVMENGSQGLKEAVSDAKVIASQANDSVAKRWRELFLSNRCTRERETEVVHRDVLFFFLRVFLCILFLAVV